MNSSNHLNYEIRPCKYAERKMLMASLSRITRRINKSYQYVGFGGLSFTDFKLFHKELDISRMISIEGGQYSNERIDVNIPYSCIEIKRGMSTDKLPEIDLKYPSVIWLDYDDPLDKISQTVFDDIKIIFSNISAGGVYIMSCNSQLHNEERKPYKKDELVKIIGESLVPYHLEDNCCIVDNAPKTIRKMVEGFCNTQISSRNQQGESIQFFPLFNFKYQDGARMYTYGGIVLDKEFDFGSFNLDDLPFINTEEPFEIKIPNITYRESFLVNKALGKNDKEQELIDKGIITRLDLEEYKIIYKYMPNFYDVRL